MSQLNKNLYKTEEQKNNRIRNVITRVNRDLKKIGGQAGISGHIKVGNNVEIGGGSGVIKNVPDNAKVMGYPAKNIREFLRDNK